MKQREAPIGNAVRDLGVSKEEGTLRVSTERKVDKYIVNIRQHLDGVAIDRKEPSAAKAGLPTCETGARS